MEPLSILHRASALRARVVLLPRRKTVRPHRPIQYDLPPGLCIVDGTPFASTIHSYQTFPFSFETWRHMCTVTLSQHRPTPRKICRWLTAQQSKRLGLSLLLLPRLHRRWPAQREEQWEPAEHPI
jgi:hypothetical protein